MKQVIDKNDYDQILEKYNGSDTKIWLYSITHSRLALRLKTQNYENTCMHPSESINEPSEP